MDQKTFRFVFRTAIAVALLVALFYLGRPVFWGISARLQEARNEKKDVSATELASHGMQELKNYVAKKTGYGEAVEESPNRRSLKGMQLMHFVAGDTAKLRFRRLLQ